MVQYQEGDVVEYRPFGGDNQVGKIEKIEAEIGGHVEMFYFIEGKKYLSCQMIGKKEK